MKLNYKILGEGAPVIILHGLFGMLDNWRTIAKHLESKYKCILVDLRNHGRSPHHPEMNYEIMAGDIHELMNDLQIDQAVLMGHSMGGKVAMQFALTYPDRISHLIVIDIAPREYPPHHQDVIDAIESLDPSTLHSRADAENALRKYLNDDEDTIQFLLKNISRLPEGGFQWKANMTGIISQYPQLMDAIINTVPFDKPVLFIAGEKSNSIRKEDLTGIEKLFPNTKFVTIRNAGHWVHADQPEALLEAFLLFMNS
jgi:pimeloyl-ACP methyl ester carboxylesterase